jgi:DNA adenine methylase
MTGSVRVLGESSEAAARPFLKWAGGKSKLLDQMATRAPDVQAINTYFEPFLGGGALYFRLRPARACLSDTNRDLVDTYAAVRDMVPEVVSNLRSLEYSEDAYYRVRAWSPRSPAKKAARFIYLNKTCFNGLYRENKSGRFNVPFGRNGPNVAICDEQQLRRASTALAHAHLTPLDFEEAVTGAGPGDFVYFDPPYTTAHANNGFVEYNAMVFSWRDQRRLATVAAELVHRGVYVMVSNASHVSIRRLYPSSVFEMIRLPRESTIAASREHRFSTYEVLLIGRPGP